MSREIEELKEAAGAYKRWALEARKKYIDLRLRQDPEIRRLYIRAAERVAGELRRLVLRTPSSYIRKAQLEQLEKSLRFEAERLVGDLTKAITMYIEEAVNAGAGYSETITLGLFEKAGIDTTGLRAFYARVNRQAVEACWARTKGGLYLSDRIWQQGENLRSTMRDLIQESVAIGQDAVKTAWMLEQYVRHGARTLARDYPNMMKRMAGRIPGDLCYEALRLVRTETTAAFGEGTIAAARVSPSYKGLKWVLSKSHPVEDICDTLAAADYGLGPGVYPPGEEPPYPAHPNELCILVPVHEEPEEFVERLKRWRNNPASEPELEKWYNTFGKDLYSTQSSSRKPSLPDISQAKTLEDCLRWAQANYPNIRFEFEGADVEAIKPTLEQFHKLAQEWPEVAERIRYIGTRRMFTGEYAHAAADGAVVGLNPKFYGNPQKFLQWLKQDDEAKYHPKGCSTIQSVFTHEFGHLVKWWLERQENVAVLPVVSPDGTGIVGYTVQNWLKHWYEKKRKLVGSLSKYALESQDEAFAEAFAATYHSKGKKTKFQASLEELLSIVSKTKWLKQYKWLSEVAGEERELALRRIKDLKERLGML